MIVVNDKRLTQDTHELYRRGDGGGDTVSHTTYATAPPASTQRHGQIPTIAGSEGGFLGLVIGLGVLVIIGCGGVWYLLKRRNDPNRPAFLAKIMGDKRKRRTTDPIPSGSGGTFSRIGGSKSGWSRTNDGYEDLSGDEGRGDLKMHPSAASDNRVYANDSNPFATPSTAQLSAGNAGPYADAFDSRPSTDSLDNAVFGNRSHRAFSPSLDGKSRFQENV